MITPPIFSVDHLYISLEKVGRMYFFELESGRAELQSEIPGSKSKETHSRHPQLPSYITLNASALLTPLLSRDEATSGLNGGPCRHSYCELDNKLPVEGGGEAQASVRVTTGGGEGRYADRLVS